MTVFSTLPRRAYQLRCYQTQLIQQVMTSWVQGNRRVMLQLPTGAGKTVLF
ncbi:MAG: DEAD/DEAH box helicase family protein [Coleofasciculus sp. Co-bin14]|nr:DEAD/DEAH box helicase family protein [Coleofasciculus sp. Co-bin14]